MPPLDFSALASRYDDFYVPRFELRVGNETFTASDGVVSDLTVETVLNGANSFSFTLAYPYDFEAGRFRGDPKQFSPGTPVEVAMGYGNRLEPLFLGTVTAMQHSFPAEGAPTIGVRGHGLLYGLRQTGSQSQTWEDATVRTVVRQVLARDTGYGFDPVTVEGPDATFVEIKQDEGRHANDLHFLLWLASQVGCEVHADRRAFYFREPAYRAEPTVTLRYGESLSSFSPRVNTAGQAERVEFRGWNGERRERVVGSASDGALDGGGERRLVVRGAVRSQDEADLRARGVLERQRADLVRGTGECLGLPVLRAGQTVELERLGDMYSKTYYVDSARHSFGESGYRTSFEVRRRSL